MPPKSFRSVRVPVSPAIVKSLAASRVVKPVGGAGSAMATEAVSSSVAAVPFAAGADRAAGSATERAERSGTAKAIEKFGVGAVAQRPEVVAVPPPFSLNQFTRRIVRPRDLLVLDFTFVNLRVESANHQLQLVRKDAAKSSYLVVGFPAQHLQERAFEETDDGVGPDDPKNTDVPVPSRLADPSRLVFRVPASFSSLPYTLDELLKACATFELSVAPSATLPDPSFVYKPGIGISESVVTLPSGKLKASGVKTAAMARSALAGRSVATRSTAALAYTAAISAEVQNQWLAKRSPLSRADQRVFEVGKVKDSIGALKLLPELAPPTATQTAIEAPTRLILSPNSAGAFVHATQPVESAQSGRVELWHTRLAVRATSGVTEKDDYRRTVRAIWSPDMKEDPLGFTKKPDPATPFVASLDAFDRHNLVHLSANHRLYLPGPKPQKRQKPLPMEVDRLMLTSLGAWLNVHGSWVPPPPLAVESWRHRATMGRDHYVRVVYAGTLYPFGHRASLIKVTERKFHSGLKGNAAFLRQRKFIIVREPFRLMGNSGVFNDQGESMNRKMPFKSARITTLVTPSLDRTSEDDCVLVPELKGDGLFWPHVNEQPFLFHLQFADESGALIDAAMPLFFLGNENLYLSAAGEKLIQDAVGKKVVKQYPLAKPVLRRTGLQGQRVQLAPTQKSGDTSFELEAMAFEVAFKNGKLFPGMAGAHATLPTLKHLARTTAAPEVKFPTVYLESGFPGSGNTVNQGQVFLELVNANTQLNLSGQGDRAGALLTPNLAITGLSRTLGPVGGAIDQIARTGFKPADFFGNLGDLLPKLFGCIKITDILDELNFGAAGFSLDKLPRFLSENLTAAQGLLDDVAKIQALLGTLSGQLPGLGAQALALSTAGTTLVTRLSALLAAPLDAAKRTSFIEGFTGLSNASRTLRGGFGGLAVPEPVQFAKTQLDQLLTKFTVGLEKAEDLAKLASGIADSLEALNEQRIKFEWKPAVKNWGLKPKPGGPATPLAPIFEVKAGGGLVIAVELAAQSGSSKEPSLNVACRLQKFDLNLLAPDTFLKLHFNKIEFTGSSHQKPDVNVDFGGIEFVGVLSFVETLRTLIPLDGFSDPPALTVSERGIEASFSLGLPTIAIGVFSLQNLSLGAAFTVPFLGAQPLSVRFNFCERSDPFRLTVWVFGGGGFFAVTVTPAGVQILEAAFEFGACVALDFGVASGSVSVMAGIYFRMEADEASLTGYLNVKGRVSVLGLITATLELALELKYEFASGKCVGRASMMIEVEVLFFSASVEVVCEKKFAGANGDPSFEQIMAPYPDPATGATKDPWMEYCGAFAA